MDGEPWDGVAAQAVAWVHPCHPEGLVDIPEVGNPPWD